MGLKIYSSNHLQVLFHHVSGHFAQAPLSPLEKEYLVVQSRGMARWLTLQLAATQGIAASLEFSLPKAFCFKTTQNLVEAPMSAANQPSIFEDRQALAWALFVSLPELLATSAFKPVAQFLEDDSGSLKRFQLCQRMADCFDNYQLYRPDMLESWEKGQLTISRQPHEKWQQLWWQQLRLSHQTLPLFRQIQHASKRLQSAHARKALPQRISVFGIATLPPLFLNLMAECARYTEVSFYVVTPTDQYWGDVLSAKEKQHNQPMLSGLEPLASGHELLASLGKQGRDFFNLLQNLDQHGQAWHSLPYPVPQRDCLLHHLQADICELVQREPNGFHQPIAISETDTSLQIHVCHSPLREIEIIRNLMLAALEQDPSLSLKDMVVMVPDIQKYAPFIQAVFASPADPDSYLPFAIADQQFSQELPLTQAFLKIVEVATGRMTAEAVLSLLEILPIRRRFSISEVDLDTVVHWIKATRIAWGEDGHHRQQAFQLPAFEENSWRAGLNRLWYAFAMGESTYLQAGVAPFGSATTSHAPLLGHLSAFLEALFEFKDQLTKSHSLETWHQIISDTLQTFFLPETGQEEEALQLLRDASASLPLIQSRYQFPDRVSYALVMEPIRQLLKQDGFGNGFISGRITFCALKPMRTIPFKWVCLAGLNDSDYPRRDAPLGFDLMATSRRRGDRNVREDDRYLFLESLLAAGSQFLVTYTGYHPTDLQPMPPASVLQELTDHLDRAFVSSELEPISQHISFHHPPQPFDSQYFNASEPSYFSYEQSHFLAAETVQNPVQPPFLEHQIEPFKVQNPLSLHDLEAFWLNPSQYFCQHQLGIQFPTAQQQLPVSETLDVSGLNRYLLDSRIFECRLQPTTKALATRLHSEGVLPPGSLGKAHFAARYSQTTPLVDAANRMGPLTRQSFQLDIGMVTVEGQLSNLGSQGLVHFRTGQVRAKQWVGIWLRHLFLQLLEPAPESLESYIFSLEPFTQFRLKAVPQARELLEWLVEQFQLGQGYPLQLFGQTSFDFAKSHWQIAQPKSRTKKLRLTTDWLPSQQGFSANRDNPYFRLCFRHEPQYETTPPEAHKENAVSFWVPFFDACEEVLP